MADVRRSRTWEDLGFSRDRVTGLWAETVVRASSPTGATTWESLGFVQDRSGRWVESVVRAKHRFDPKQLRDPGGEHGGQWVKNPAGAFKDELNLAGRIHLDPGERLVSSSRLADSSGADVDLLFAVVHSPHGHEVRIGVIPSGDAGKWTADAKGATAGLSSDELRRARTELAAASAAADKAAEEVEQAREAGRPVTDPKLSGAAPFASGQLLSANHDDLDWAVFLNDQAAWDLSITPTRGEFDGAVLDPLDTEALLTHLADLQNQLD